MKIEDYINKAKYDDSGQMIFGVQNDGEHRYLLDLRGWGGIRNLINDENKAMKFQDSVGEWIAEAINEKLERCKNEN